MGVDQVWYGGGPGMVWGWSRYAMGVWYSMVWGMEVMVWYGGMGQVLYGSEWDMV